MYIKKLEKSMSYSEMSEYIENHKKYRLLDINELKYSNVTHATFSLNSYQFDTIEDGNTYTIVTVYEPTSDSTCNINTLIRLPVYLTYSEEYLEFHKECLSHLSKADPMVIGNILLRRMVEEFL